MSFYSQYDGCYVRIQVPCAPLIRSVRDGSRLRSACVCVRVRVSREARWSCRSPCSWREMTAGSASTSAARRPGGTRGPPSPHPRVSRKDLNAMLRGLLILISKRLKSSPPSLVATFKLNFVCLHTSRFWLHHFIIFFQQLSKFGASRVCVQCCRRAVTWPLLCACHAAPLPFPWKPVGFWDAASAPRRMFATTDSMVRDSCTHDATEAIKRGLDALVQVFK